MSSILPKGLLPINIDQEKPKIIIENGLIKLPNGMRFRVTVHNANGKLELSDADKSQILELAQKVLNAANTPFKNLAHTKINKAGIRHQQKVIKGTHFDQDFTRVTQVVKPYIVPTDGLDDSTPIVAESPSLISEKPKPKPGIEDQLEEITQVLKNLDPNKQKLKLDKNGQLKTTQRKLGSGHQKGKSKRSKEAMQHIFYVLEKASKIWDQSKVVKDVLNQLKDNRWAKRIIDQSVDLTDTFGDLMEVNDMDQYIKPEILFSHVDSQHQSFVSRTLLHGYRWNMSSKDFFDKLLAHTENLKSNTSNIIEEKQAILNTCVEWFSSPHLHEGDVYKLEVNQLIADILMEISSEDALNEQAFQAVLQLKKVVESNVKPKQITYKPKDVLFLKLADVFTCVTMPTLPSHTRQRLLTNVVDDFNTVYSLRFAAITTSDWVGQFSNSKELDSPGVQKMIEEFNLTSNLFVKQILNTPNLEGRVRLVEFIIDLARKAADSGNLQLAMALIGALGDVAVDRLKKTWGAVSPDHKQIKEELKELLSPSSSYANLRKEVNLFKKEGKSCIPFIGLYLQDLTFIRDGNPTYLDDSTDLNLMKLEMLTKIIRTIKEQQKLLNDSHVLNYSLSESMATVFAPKQTKKEFGDLVYQKSLKIEPRGS